MAIENAIAGWGHRQTRQSEAGTMATVKQIQYFLAVAEAQSIRRAADRLDVAQPTLSTQLSALEKSLGVTLFERSRRVTQLTPAGRELLSTAKQLIAKWHELQELAHTLSDTAATTHRLGVPPTLGPYLLPNIVPAIHQKFERLKLYVREEQPSQLEGGVLDGRYDLALVPLPLSNDQLAIEVLFREPLLVIAAKEAGLAVNGKLREEQLAGMSILGLDERHRLHQEVQRICDRTGARINRDYEGTSLDTLRQMVVMGMGIALLPALYIRSEIHRPEELDVIKVEGAQLFREHALIFRAGSPVRHLYQELAQLIRERMGEAFSDVVTPIYNRSA
ncbi:transcriptional regulator, LysR family [Luminiphilus syltensis NOR5-1B]|uniref:Transcriptional regulator, LysR family n=1 Tax=Luminiphilus syltensis NOR5-1B TaxID=565045 RepID=B8KUV9_9GAMM|nr:hydrogen peroxide-inducible genes activator [Luminiphilus syltensis]EED34216.1 transcriptional regulator, LysR family [Luminiphilus syltensis NOR5-1B]